jgi:hypothetical protein
VTPTKERTHHRRTSTAEPTPLDREVPYAGAAPPRTSPTSLGLRKPPPLVRAGSIDSPVTSPAKVANVISPRKVRYAAPIARRCLLI